MRRSFYNKWFTLAFLLLTSLSAFSFVAYKNARNVCAASGKYQGKASPVAENILPWDVISSQFSSVSTH